MEIWKEGRIRDFADVKGGKRLPKGKQLVGFPTAHPYIRIRDIGKSKVLQLTPDYVYVDDETQKDISRYIVAKGDILISVVGTIGLIGIVGDTLEGANQTENCDKLTNLNGIDRDYLYYYLVSSLGQAEIKKGTVGAVQPKLPLKNIQNFMIHYPTLETQRKIASVLSALDDKIEKNTEVNENLYQMVATLYASIFRERVQQTTTVGQYSKQIYSGGTPSTSKPEFWNGPLHWFSSGETRNRFAITTEKTITQVGVDNSSTKLAHKYDIVMASAGQGFTRGQTTMLLLDTYVNQSVIVIHSDHLHLPYLFWNLSSRYEELRAISDSSSIRGSLTTKMIAGFDIPEVDQQSLVRFSEFAWPIIAEIEKNLHENEHLSAIRDMLLPKLMSGEIDVSDYNF